MYVLTSYFEKLLVNLSPPQDRLDLARDIPPLVRDFLKEHSAFSTISPHSRLVGSYAQHLSVGDVKDVDFLVFVDDLGEGLDRDPVEVLNDLKRTLDELPEHLEFEGSARFDITKNRRSVTVVFEDEPFYLDVVPCVAPDGVDEPIYVPDRGFEDWIKSDPLGVIDLIKTLNDELNGRPRQLLKLLKHFRSTQMQYMKPKSYWLLAMGIREIQAEKIDCDLSPAECFNQLLEAIYARYKYTLDHGSKAPAIPDPMLGHNVAHSWKRNDFVAWMSRLEDGIRWSNKALNTDDKTEAIQLWQKVFGSEFPDDIEDEARSMAERFRPGYSSVTSSGALVTGSQINNAIPVKGTRFYGKS